MKRILGIIPARYLSSRLPGKPLVDIGGKSMICRVYDQCLKSASLTDVWVATDDQRIYDEITGNGGKALLSSTKHLTGTERCFEAFEILKSRGEEYDILVNIQGDEPFINPRQIDLLTAVLLDAEDPIATLVYKITNDEELWDENVVKVVCSLNDKALYFSRSPIPFLKNTEKNSWLQRANFYKHVGIYAFKSSAIASLVQLQATPLEKAENLEQLRWLESGYSIKTAVTVYQTISVDTPEDLERARKQAQLFSTSE
ncbi:MAG: 3-deoxy-manno-octulosonate cytidylyltransferase [Flavobacteriales bacterium]|nr:3-deoxy-manno-octulosonate cytidylyltransferase [Flavobacteriales bacterium]